MLLTLPDLYLDNFSPKRNPFYCMEQSFGEQIKSLRESKRLTLKQASAALGIDISMLSKIEKGRRTANSELIKSLSNLFDVKQSELNVSMASDLVAMQVVKKYSDNALEILKAAEKKVANSTNPTNSGDNEIN